MIEHFEDLCTHAYVLVDDCYRVAAAPADRRPGPKPAFSDAELVTLELVGELIGLDKETDLLGYVRRNHLALFPLLPERSRYNRRRRALGGAISAVRREVCGRLLRLVASEHPDGEAALGPLLIDSMPVPAVGLSHSRGEHRWYGYAAYGRCPSKRGSVYGFRLHTLIAGPGAVVDFALAPANRHDRALAPQLLADLRQAVAVGDGAYADSALERELRDGRGVALVAPRREGQRGRQPGWALRAIKRTRQLAEAVHSQLACQFNVATNHAKSVSGLVARVHSKLAAHTLGIYLNAALGRHPLSLKDLAVI